MKYEMYIYRIIFRFLSECCRVLREGELLSEYIFFGFFIVWLCFLVSCLYRLFVI